MEIRERVRDWGYDTAQLAEWAVMVAESAEDQYGHEIRVEPAAEYGVKESLTLPLGMRTASEIETELTVLFYKIGEIVLDHTSSGRPTSHPVKLHAVLRYQEGERWIESSAVPRLEMLFTPMDIVPRAPVPRARDFRSSSMPMVPAAPAPGSSVIPHQAPQQHQPQTHQPPPVDMSPKMVDPSTMRPQAYEADALLATVMRMTGHTVEMGAMAARAQQHATERTLSIVQDQGIQAAAQAAASRDHLVAVIQAHSTQLLETAKRHGEELQRLNTQLLNSQGDYRTVQAELTRIQSDRHAEKAQWERERTELKQEIKSYEEMYHSAQEELSEVSREAGVAEEKVQRYKSRAAVAEDSLAKYKEAYEKLLKKVKQLEKTAGSGDTGGMDPSAFIGMAQQYLQSQQAQAQQAAAPVSAPVVSPTPAAPVEDEEDPLGLGPSLDSPVIGQIYQPARFSRRRRDRREPRRGRKESKAPVAAAKPHAAPAAPAFDPMQLMNVTPDQLVMATQLLPENTMNSAMAELATKNPTRARELQRVLSRGLGDEDEEEEDLRDDPLLSGEDGVIARRVHEDDSDDEDDLDGDEDDDLTFDEDEDDSDDDDEDDEDSDDEDDEDEDEDEDDSDDEDDDTDEEDDDDDDDDDDDWEPPEEEEEPPKRPRGRTAVAAKPQPKPKPKPRRR